MSHDRGARSAVGGVGRAREALLRIKGSVPAEARLAEMLANPANILFPANASDRAVGFLFAHILGHLSSDQHLFLYEIEVEEAMRGASVGRALVAAAKDVADTRCGGEMFLITNRLNEAAMALNRSAGGSASNLDDVVIAWPARPVRGRSVRFRGAAFSTPARSSPCVRGSYLRRIV